MTMREKPYSSLRDVEVLKAYYIQGMYMLVCVRIHTYIYMVFLPEPRPEL